jgi:hypothetical protein
MSTAPRPRAAIYEELRDVPALRAAHRTGDPHADRIFRGLSDGRADRLLDELPRHREAASPRRPR